MIWGGTILLYFPQMSIAWGLSHYLMITPRGVKRCGIAFLVRVRCSSIVIGYNRGEMQRELRKLPSVDALLQERAIKRLLAQSGREVVVASIRAVLEEARQAIGAGQPC